MKKNEIIAYFKQKYPALNLSSKRLDEIAARLEDKVKDESELEAKLDALNEILPFAEIAKEDDARRVMESKLKAVQRKPEPQKETPKEDEESKSPDLSKTPELAKAIADAIAVAVKPISEKLEQLQGEKIFNSRKSSYEKILNGVDEKTKQRALEYFERLTKGMTDEEYAEFEKKEAEYYQTLIQEQKVENLGGLPPINGNGSNGKVSDKELDAIVESLPI